MLARAEAAIESIKGMWKHMILANDQAKFEICWAAHSEGLASGSSVMGARDAAAIAGSSGGSATEREAQDHAMFGRRRADHCVIFAMAEAAIESKSGVS